MSEQDPPPATRPGRRPGGGAVLTALAGVAVVGATVCLAAVASLEAQRWPLMAAGAAVLAGSLAISLLVPTGLGLGIVRALRSRGRKPRARAVTAGTIVLFDLGVIVLVQVLSPVPLVRLLPERGTWVADALTGRGPFGPAAVPIVQRQVVEVIAIRALADAGPRWCDETAAAVATGLAGGLRDRAAPPLEDTLAGVLQRYGVDPATGEIPPGVAGRDLLVDVLDVAGAVVPTVPLPDYPTVDATPSKVERRRIVFATPGWEARYEDDAWRVCTGTTADGRLVGRDLARSMRDAAALLPSGSARVAGPWDADVRGALRVAVHGRTAFLAGVAGLEPGWPEALTRAAAAAQAERVRTWCAAASSGDPAATAALSALAVRWGVGAPGEVADPTSRALVEAQGRKYLADVLAACGPVAAERQKVEAARGLPIPDLERRRWAEQRAAAIGSAAQLADDGAGGVRIEVEGKVFRAVQEDGAWRVDLRD